MEIYIKPFIYIVICLFLLWQLLKWFIPYLFNSLMSYIQGVVLEGQDSKAEVDYLNLPNTFEYQSLSKESFAKQIDFEEID